MALLVGAQAPSFALAGWHQTAEQTFDLDLMRGRPVVLAFYPGDERMVCTKQMCSYSDSLGDLEVFHAAVWGIAPQNVESHREFAAGRKLQLPLLSDPGNVVARTYGVVGAFGLRRSVFVVDAHGRIAWRWVSALNVTFPGIDAIGAALKELPAAA